MVVPIHNEPIDEVSYLCYIENSAYKDCFVIDPFDAEAVMAKLDELKRKLSLIILTHEHYDHAAGINILVNATGAKMLCSKTCAENVVHPKHDMSQLFEAMISFHGVKINEKNKAERGFSINQVDVTLDDHLDYRWDDVTLHLKLTPGHSPGSICIQASNALFTGDSLLRDAAPMLRFPGGSKEQFNTITLPYLRFLRDQDEDYIVYPGHGESFKLKDSRFLST